MGLLFLLQDLTRKRKPTPEEKNALMPPIMQTTEHYNQEAEAQWGKHGPADPGQDSAPQSLLKMKKERRN